MMMLSTGRTEGSFLQTQGTSITHGGRPIRLQGINLGGWLMMEGYILHAPNRGVCLFQEGFSRQLGPSALNEFDKAFRKNFVREDDFRRIARLGFNCVRVPFHHRLVETRPSRFDSEGVRYLDLVLEWARRCGLWVILDLHAACGSQNHDWHSDSTGPAALWTNKVYQDRTAALWEFLSDRYRDRPELAGYDLLNEAVVADHSKLNEFYNSVIKAIRRSDRKHIVFVEGEAYARNLECLDEFDDEQLVYSVHYYDPLEFTFNFIPGLRYPLKPVKRKGGFNVAMIRQGLDSYRKFSEKRRRPVFVGEFGVNSRDGLYGEEIWLKDTLRCFEESGFHWTYWTYKAVKNSAFPDGLFSFRGNPPWINRQGPETGWERYAACWNQYQREMTESWRTEAYSPNKELLKIFKNFFKSNR